jgi:hypothetical protein
VLIAFATAFVVLAVGLIWVAIKVWRWVDRRLEG